MTLPTSCATSSARLVYALRCSSIPGNGTIRKELHFTELADANIIAEYVARSNGKVRLEVEMPESLLRKFQDRDRQRKHSAS